MISTDRAPPLYIFVKPPVGRLAELRRLRALFGIESRYALDRLHCTFLPLGESRPEIIEAARDILASFPAEPFEIALDHVEGVTLQPRKGMRGPGLFQRALARHFALSGFTLPDYKFSLHLNLDYGNPSNRRASVAALSWTVDEVLLIESAFGRHILHGQHGLAVRQYALAL